MLWVTSESSEGARQREGEGEHMSQKQLAYGLIVVGVVLALASLLVDVIGVGTEGFGIAQIVGLILGIVLVGVGVYRGFVRQSP